MGVVGPGVPDGRQPVADVRAGRPVVRRRRAHAVRRGRPRGDHHRERPGRAGRRAADRVPAERATRRVGRGRGRGGRRRVASVLQRGVLPGPRVAAGQHHAAGRRRRR